MFLSSTPDDQPLRPDDRLADRLSPEIALTLAAHEVETAEDLYECMATGATWFRAFTGIDAKRATELVRWMRDAGKAVGEVTERFFLPGKASEANHTNGTNDSTDTREAGGAAREGAAAALRDGKAAAGILNRPRGGAKSGTGVRPNAGTGTGSGAPLPAHPGIVPLERIVLPAELDGSEGLNRAPAFGCSLEARNDLEAIRTWLDARAGNPNTYANYRKEAERFLLWCLYERETALSGIKAGDASKYLRWLEELGRRDERDFGERWKLPAAVWIGPKNATRDSAAWRPFNGPLGSASRRNALVVVRQLCNFLKKTGYLIFNPFDQVSPKVPLLKGEGAPQAFADRSLTDMQWREIADRLELLPEGLPRERMRLILMLGKSLGLRASEMLEARASWIVERRVGFSVRLAIEVLGKGSKVRRLPLNAEQRDIIESAFRARGLPGYAGCDPETPLLVNLGRGRNPHGPMSRSGLYRVLEAFFDRVADEIAVERPRDAAKLRAASTHWLRHTFAVTALTKTSVNVVQAAMGHASVATTGRYLAPEEEEMSKALESIRTF